MANYVGNIVQAPEAREELHDRIKAGFEKRERIQRFVNSYTVPKEGDASESLRDTHQNIKLENISAVGVNDANRGALRSDLIAIVKECRDTFTTTLTITEKPVDEISISTWVGGRTAGRKFMALAADLGIAVLDKGEWNKAASLKFTEKSLITQKHGLITK